MVSVANRGSGTRSERSIKEKEQRMVDSESE